MQRLSMLCSGIALLLTLLLAGPLVAQEFVAGFFEGPAGGGNAGTGAIPVTGWAVADSGVSRVIIQVDGVDLSPAKLGLKRPIVSQDWPGFPDSEAPGFGLQLNSTGFENGLHTVSARVETMDGNSFILSGTQDILFTNTSALLVPFGRINRPKRAATMTGTCARACDSTDAGLLIRYEPVVGWALDLGLETEDTGVGYVELLIDGGINGNTRTSCFFNQATGGLTNCYGLPRLDIERRFPFAFNAPNAGFRFALDVGALITCQELPRGAHDLTIRVGDVSSQTADVDVIPVIFACREDTNEPSFGDIDTPHRGRVFGGDIRLEGWALDDEGVDRVRIFMDGLEVGDAATRVRSRPSVAAEFPGFPDSDRPVWRLDPFDTTTLTDGLHQMQVLVVDDEGETTIIGEATFLVRNDGSGP